MSAGLHRVVLADDDHEWRRLASHHMRAAGLEVIETRDGTWVAAVAARGGLASLGVSAIVTDVRMPSFGGLDILHRVRRTRPDLPIVLVTGFGGRQFRREALGAGANEVVDKPVDFDRLADVVRSLVGRTM